MMVMGLQRGQCCNLIRLATRSQISFRFGRPFPTYAPVLFLQDARVGCPSVECLLTTEALFACRLPCLILSDD
jgi:hypothetical protein